jgi:Nuclease-related domain
MKNRPGERSRLLLRRRQFRTIRKNLVVWFCLVLFAAILAEIFRLEPGPESMRFFLFGFLTASTLAAFAWMVFIMSGSYSHSMGRLGEEATADCVTSLRRRRQGWQIVNGISLGHHGDVDHVLLGPGGVFVIESKWTTSDCELIDGRIVGILGREPIAQAREGARTIEKMLRYGRQRFDVTVRPVVVIWGQGGLCLEDGWIDVEGTIVCEGRQNKLWLQRLQNGLLGSSVIEEMSAVLRNQVDRQVSTSQH